MLPQASFHQIHAVRVSILQCEEASNYNILLNVISLFVCHPALDSRGRRSVSPPLCTALVLWMML